MNKLSLELSKLSLIYNMRTQGATFVFIEFWLTICVLRGPVARDSQVTKQEICHVVPANRALRNSTTKRENTNKNGYLEYTERHLK